MSARAIGLFGVGLIGGSIGMRARANGARVLGYDRDATALAQAHACGAIDAAVGEDELTRSADVLVLAAHLEPTLGKLAALHREYRPRPALVIDVASVKVPVVAAARGLANFVATHPLAGSECAGVRAARADLFEGRSWAYVPSGDDQRDRRACEFIASLGGLPFALSAEEHDRVVALTSHLPQLLAVCYARLLRDRDVDERLGGPVARELLRISKMNFAMWRETLRSNARNIDPELRRLNAALLSAADALAAGKLDDLEMLFESGAV
jgi:prephenate dehydrogenase